MDIFFSYSSKDRSRVRPIVESLQSHGWRVWWDRTIPPGMTFDEVIEEALDNARCVVVAWSTESVKRHWVRTEAGEGRERGILVPVLLDQVKPPLEFRRIQAANLATWDGDQSDTEYIKLVTRIAQMLGEPAPMGHSVELAPSTGEWESDLPGLVEESDLSGLVEETDVPPDGIIVDSRAVQAMAGGADLYPVGVLDVIGNFRVGAGIAIYDDTGQYAGEATAAYSSQEIRRIRGQQSRQIRGILGLYRGDAVVAGESYWSVEDYEEEVEELEEVWMAEGGLSVDSGALRAMRKGANLLPVGILEVYGEFNAGALVELYDQNGTVIAEGDAEYSAHEINLIKGQQSDRIDQILGLYRGDAVVLNDSLVWM